MLSVNYAKCQLCLVSFMQSDECRGTDEIDTLRQTRQLIAIQNQLRPQFFYTTDLWTTTEGRGE
jgi:hypothetical protein